MIGSSASNGGDAVIDKLVGQHWTVRGPDPDQQAGEVFHKITIEELPRFVAVGSTPYEVICGWRSKLRKFLTDSVERGDKIPLPRAQGLQSAE